MLNSSVIGQSSHLQPLRVTAALLSIAHLVLAIAIALSAVCGGYSGDWTWWLSQAHFRTVR